MFRCKSSLLVGKWGILVVREFSMEAIDQIKLIVSQLINFKKSKFLTLTRSLCLFQHNPSSLTLIHDCNCVFEESNAQFVLFISIMRKHKMLTSESLTDKVSALISVCCHIVILAEREDCGSTQKSLVLCECSSKVRCCRVSPSFSGAILGRLTRF